MSKASQPRRRVLLAEEEALFRDGLRSLLEDEFRVVGAVTDFESLRAAVARLRPDVVVAGLSLLLARGIEEAGALRAATRDARIVIVAREPRSAVPLAPALGASGWVLRNLGLDSSAALVRYAIHNEML